jgi:hypothetical protein
MAKRISLSSIIKPDESEYVNATDLDAGLTDAYQPVLSGSAVHARPLPVNMYTYDDESEQFEDTPLARAPMRINRRYVPTNKENLPLKQSVERPEFPLYQEQKNQTDSGTAYPKSTEKFTQVNQFKNNSNDSMIYHDFEDEVMNEFVTADPHVIGLLQKTGRAIPIEVALSDKMRRKNANVIKTTSSASERMKQSPRLFAPSPVSNNQVKKKNQNLIQF